MFLSKSKISTTHYQYLCALQNPYFKFFSNFSESKQSPPTHSSLSLAFLTDSCGLSEETALRVSKRMKNLFEKKDKKPKSVITFLENTGFSKTHISKLISRCPGLLFSNVKKTIEPKIKHFQDLGLSGFQVGELIASKPYVMLRSLESQIIPTLVFVRSFVHTNENVRKVLKRTSFLLSGNAISRMQPNIDFLRDRGVPDSEIVRVIMIQPGVLMVQMEIMKGIVERVERLGFKPGTRMFTIAVNVMCSMSKATWDSKIELLKGLGWSEEQIFDSFRRQPMLLTSSVEKLKQGIDFYANNMNFDASVISKYPIFLMLSLKGRVIPRLAVFKILMSKKMVKENAKLSTMLYLTEKEFLRKYVIKYQDELPDLLQTYKSRCKLECKEGTGDSSRSSIKSKLHYQKLRVQKALPTV